MLHVEAFDVSRRTGGQSPKDGLELVLVADLGLWSPDRLPLRLGRGLPTTGPDSCKASESLELELGRVGFCADHL